MFDDFSAEESIFVGIGRSAAAEQAESLGGSDLVPGAGGNKDGITWGDSAGFAIDFHGAVAFEDEVELLTELVIVTLGRLTNGNGGFGEGLVLNRCVGLIQDAADRAAVFGGEWRLLGKLVDRHGCVCHRRALSHERQAHA